MLRKINNKQSLFLTAVLASLTFSSEIFAAGQSFPQDLRETLKRRSDEKKKQNLTGSIGVGVGQSGKREEGEVMIRLEKSAETTQREKMKKVVPDNEVEFFLQNGWSVNPEDAQKWKQSPHHPDNYHRAQ